MTTLFAGIVIVLCLILAAALVFVCRRLRRTAAHVPQPDDWMQPLSSDRYRPMQRLFDEGEYAALRAHPACTRKMLRRFRACRAQVFRGYLECLSADYNGLCLAIKLLMVQSAQDRPDLAALLVRQRALFTVRLLLAECRLQLHAFGIGRVDVAKLVSALDSMRLEWNCLLAVTRAA